MRHIQWNLFRNRRRSDELQALLTKISGLEEQISQLKQEALREPEGPPPIIIEHICIENLNVDKIDYENNIGALGIRELSGQLNIGANYLSGKMNRPRKEKPGSKAAHPPPSYRNEGPRYTIRGRPQPGSKV